MKLKNILTILFALVMAFAVFTFVACNNEKAPDGGENAQPEADGGNKEQEEQGTPSTSAKISEEQWRAAFTELSESYNFYVQIYEYDNDSGETVLLVEYEVDGNVIREVWDEDATYYSYDGETKALTVYSEYDGEWSTYIPSDSEYDFDAEWIEDGEHEVGGYYSATGNFISEEISLSDIEVEDAGDTSFSLCKFGDLEFYGKYVNVDIPWYGPTKCWLTDNGFIILKQASREFESTKDILLNWCEFGDLRLIGAHFSGTAENGAEADGEMIDLYSCFTYDEEKDSYTFLLRGYYCELCFEDGKISEATIILNYGEEWEQRLYCTFTFGSADITLPEVA